MEKKNKMEILFSRPLKLTGIIVLLMAFGIWIFSYSRSEKETQATPTFTVEHGPLKISVIESGAIQARENIVVKSEVEGTTSIISLVEEGARVKKGDLLVELDTSQLLDQKIDQEIKVQNSEASFIGARENLAVVENQAQSDVDKAQLAQDFALQDLDKYRQGEYPNQLKSAESTITLAQEELTRAREKLEWSNKLYAEKYISLTELEADELSEKQKALALELAQNDLNLLKNYTHKRNLAQLESDVKQAKMTLERTRRKASADVVQAKADLQARKAEYKQQQDKLEKIITQIDKTKIYAPVEGQVIYATSVSKRGIPSWRRSAPLEEGQQVRERQELIYLPTSKGFNAEIGIYEASLDKVRPGLEARVTVDALPGQVFTGRVQSIAPLPDALSAFLNPNLKIYPTVIQLDKNGASDLLRAGMNCTAEIIVEQFQEATFIPVQAVLRVGGKPTVFVLKGQKMEPRTVETGLDNNAMVRIKSGLEPGEIVSLSPPLAQASLTESETKSSPGVSTDQGPTTPDKPVTARDSQRTPGPGSTNRGDRPENGFMDRFDSDHDGKVSKQEFTGPAQIFDRLDKDGDGFIAGTEIPSGSRPGTTGSRGEKTPQDSARSGGQK